MGCLWHTDKGGRPLRTDQLERVQFIALLAYEKLTSPGHHPARAAEWIGAKADAINRVGTKVQAGETFFQN